MSNILKLLYVLFVNCFFLKVCLISEFVSVHTFSLDLFRKRGSSHNVATYLDRNFKFFQSNFPIFNFLT